MILFLTFYYCNLCDWWIWKIYVSLLQQMIARIPAVSAHKCWRMNRYFHRTNRKPIIVQQIKQQLNISNNTAKTLCLTLVFTIFICTWKWNCLNAARLFCIAHSQNEYKWILVFSRLSFELMTKANHVRVNTSSFNQK